MNTRPLERTKHPGIYKRGNRYVVIYRDPQGRQRKRAARTLAEARDLKATLRADVTRGEYRSQSRTTFAEYAAEWLDSYAGRTRRGLGEGTRADYRLAIEREAMPFFARSRLTAIEPRDVKRFAASLSERGLAPSSVSKIVAPLRALLATAVEDGLIRSNPALGLRLSTRIAVEPTEEPVKALSEAELSRVLAKLPDEWLPFFRFLAQTGLRISEAIEARYGDVDGTWLSVERQFYRGRVTLPKGRKRRRVPLSPELARELWNRRKTGASDDLLFTSVRGRRIDPHNLATRILKPAGRAAGVGDWIHLHTFRHSCATLLFVRQGWNAVQVCRFLGHSDPGFTLRTYVHLLPEDLPEPSFPRMEGNKGATSFAEKSRNIEPLAQKVSAL